MSQSNVKKLPSNIAVARKVDRLGALNAQARHILDQAEAIKNELKALGEGEYVGRHYKAVVSKRETERLNILAVRNLLTRQQIRKCTTTCISTAISLFDL